jgi:hypothetical protein
VSETSVKHKDTEKFRRNVREFSNVTCMLYQIRVCAVNTFFKERSLHNVRVFKCEVRTRC